MKHVAPNLNPPVITDADELQALCKRLARAGSFAFDTEFIMEDTDKRAPCLIQVATEDEVALIDPLAKLDCSPVWELVTDPTVEVIVHAGSEDLAICHQVTGSVPSNVFDLQVAAGLVKCDYPLSLARLVQSFLRVRLHKSQTLTDWRRRPLSDAQRRYAVEDVAYLPAVHRLLLTRLKRARRLEWAQEEFARFETPETYLPPREAKLFRLKGIGSLGGQNLAIALELLQAREELARQFGRPARAVLRDHLLVEIARHGWTRVEDIRSLRGLQLRSTALKQLADAARNGKARPREQWPVPPPTIEETPQEQVLATLLTAVLRDFCRNKNIAFGLLATKQTVRALLHARAGKVPPTSPLLSGWRAEAVGPIIDDLLNGRRAVRVVQDGSSARLDLMPTDPTRGDKSKN